MGILVACRCGQEFETADVNAGRRVTCPVCRKPLVIPRGFETETPGASEPATPVETSPYSFVTVYSGYAIASLSTGLLSLLCLALTGIPAVIFGLLGLRDIRAGRARVRGAGMAFAGIVLGAFGTILTGVVAFPIVNSIRESVTSQECTNRLKTIGHAMLSYHGQYGRFPRAAIIDKQRRPLLSWRVAILPYMGSEGEALYRQFHLDEPWDSPHNLPLSQTTPWFYVCPSRRSLTSGMTTYQVVVGPSTMFTGGRGIALSEIDDGSYATLLVGEAAQPVPWSAPSDMNYNQAVTYTAVGRDHPDGLHVLFADGSVRLFNSSAGPTTFQTIVNRDDTTNPPKTNY